MSKGLSDKLPTGTDKIASAKDLVINAQNVYVNGKTTSASKPNNNSSTILGPMVSHYHQVDHSLLFLNLLLL